MENVKTIERLEWEARGLETEIELTKATLVRAAKDLQARAQRAMEETTDLVEGRTSSLMWIEFAQSDIEAVRKAEEYLRLLQEKHRIVSRFLDFARSAAAAE